VGDGLRFKVGRKAKWAGGLSRPVEVEWGGPVDFNREVWAQTEKEVFSHFLHLNSYSNFRFKFELEFEFESHTIKIQIKSKKNPRFSH
jgi:hypothetical protein